MSRTLAIDDQIAASDLGRLSVLGGTTGFGQEQSLVARFIDFEK
jgi:hypothetical protein